jgi:ribonuclease Z
MRWSRLVLVACLAWGAREGVAMRIPAPRVSRARRHAPLAMMLQKDGSDGLRGKYVRCSFAGCRKKAGDDGLCDAHAGSPTPDPPSPAASARTTRRASPRLPMPVNSVEAELAGADESPEADMAEDGPLAPFDSASAEVAEGHGAGPAMDAAPNPTSSDEVQGADMEMIFLGTGSCLPTVARGVACTILRLDSSFWMFDAGEGTQVQLQRSMVRPGAIDKIFITHLHGDHAYGLPGVLCLIGNARTFDEQPIDIYGPAGLRLFLRTALALSRARAVPRYRVHELHDIPFLHTQFAREPPPVRVVCAPHAPFELEGRDILPEPFASVDGSSSLQWRLVEEEHLAVRAAPLQHSVPCVGYVIREADRPGKLRVDAVLPRLEQNRELLRAEGVRDPRKLLRQVKALQPGEVLELPDGTCIREEDALEAPQPGRKVAILGDTCDASPIAQLARGADVVVHEATNTYMRDFDGADERRFRQQTFAHGHSTPRVAADFATDVGARALVLTHFSQRYHPLAARAIRAIESEARRALDPDVRVVAAHDLSRCFVSRLKVGPALQFIPAPDESVRSDQTLDEDFLPKKPRAFNGRAGGARPSSSPRALGGGRQ